MCACVCVHVHVHMRVFRAVHASNTKAEPASYDRMCDERTQSSRQRAKIFDASIICLLQCVQHLFDAAASLPNLSNKDSISATRRRVRPVHEVLPHRGSVGGASMLLAPHAGSERRRGKRLKFSWTEWNGAACMLLSTLAQLVDLVVEGTPG